MTDVQYFWLMLALVANSVAILLVALAVRSHTKAAQAVVVALMAFAKGNEMITDAIVELNKRERER